MNCQQATKYIWDYCDNRLSPIVSKTLEAHCAECTACRRHLQLTRIENEVLQHSDNLPLLSSDFTERVMRTLTATAPTISRQSSHNKRKEQLRHQWLGASAAILGTLLVLLILPGLFPQQNIPGPNIAQQPRTLGQADSKLPQANPTAKETYDSNKSAAITETGTAQTGDSAGEGSDSAAQGSSGARAGKTIPGDNTVSRSVTSAEPTPNLEDINNFPFPVGFSTDYQLVAVNSIASNSVEFQFTKPGSNVVVDVIVSRLDASTTKSTGASQKSASNPDSTPQPMTAASLNAAPPAGSDAALQSNSVLSWSIEENGQTYRVTLNGNLNPQDLTQLANSIKFQIRN